MWFYLQHLHVPSYQIYDNEGIENGLRSNDKTVHFSKFLSKHCFPSQAEGSALRSALEESSRLPAAFSQISSNSTFRFYISSWLTVAVGTCDSLWASVIRDTSIIDWFSWYQASLRRNSNDGPHYWTSFSKFIDTTFILLLYSIHNSK